jgi:hypothetical protein
MIPKRRLCAIIAAAMGAGVLAVSIALRSLPEVQASVRARCIDDFTLLHFQLTRSAGELAQVLGSSGDVCRGSRVAALDAINRLDLLGLIPLYGAFLLAATAWLVAGSRKLYIAALGAVILALAGDVLETRTQLALTKSLEPPQLLLSMLVLGATTKFLGLALHSTFCAVVCVTHQPRRRVLGSMLLLTLPVTIAALVDRSLAPFLNLGLLLYFVALLAASIAGVLSGARRAQPTVARANVESR